MPWIQFRPGADAHPYNAGGIRTELPSCNITYGDKS